MKIGDKRHEKTKADYENELANAALRRAEKNILLKRATLSYQDACAEFYRAEHAMADFLRR